MVEAILGRPDCQDRKLKNGNPENGIVKIENRKTAILGRVVLQYWSLGLAGAAEVQFWTGKPQYWTFGRMKDTPILDLCAHRGSQNAILDSETPILDFDRTKEIYQIWDTGKRGCQVLFSVKYYKNSSRQVQDCACNSGPGERNFLGFVTNSNMT